MEILDAQESLLSDYEVLDLLKTSADESNGPKSRKSGTPHHQNNVATIQYEALNYLNSLPSTNYKEANIKSFLEATREMGLTKIEKLQIINLRPLKPVDLFPIVEEMETRFTEDEMNELFEIIQTTLPGSS